MKSNKKKNIIVLTGAGISAESGLRTFRDAEGLWEGEDVMAVASITGWQQDPKRVLDFYNQRMVAAAHAAPNKAHRTLHTLEEDFSVQVITQNVDDLHEQAGSTHVLHLHGELKKACSELNPTQPLSREGPLQIGQCCPQGGQLRPFIVWFGEPVPLLPVAAAKMAQADICFVIGTSLQVYPAAGLLESLPARTPVYVVCKELPEGPRPQRYLWATGDLHLYEEAATVGLPKAVAHMRAHYAK